MAIKPGISEDELYRLADEESDWEYLDERLVVYSPASLRREDLFHLLPRLLCKYLDERGAAQVYGPRLPMRLDDKWSPERDLLVVQEPRSGRDGPSPRRRGAAGRGRRGLLR